MSTESRLIALVEQVGADHKALHLSIGDLTALKTLAKTDLVVALNELFDRPSGGGGLVIDDSDYEQTNYYPSDKVVSAFKLMTIIHSVQTTLGNLFDDAGWDSGETWTDGTISSAKLKEVLDAMGVTMQGINTSLNQLVVDEVSGLRTELTAGASAALDTFKELADALNNDPSFATTLATQMSKRLRFDAAQSLSTAEKLQACQNLGIGNPEVDLLAAYNAAKA